jgi:hypothetical protein
MLNACNIAPSVAPLILVVIPLKILDKGSTGDSINKKDGLCAMTTLQHRVVTCYIAKSRGRRLYRKTRQHIKQFR